MQPGTKVEWIAGAVGLQGTVIGSQYLPDAEPQWKDLLVIYTKHGTYHEFPKNIKKQV